jgi:hypothetical protein
MNAEGLVPQYPEISIFGLPRRFFSESLWGPSDELLLFMFPFQFWTAGGQVLAPVALRAPSARTYPSAL